MFFYFNENKPITFNSDITPFLCAYNRITDANMNYFSGPFYNFCGGNDLAVNYFNNNYGQNFNFLC